MAPLSYYSQIFHIYLVIFKKSRSGRRTKKPVETVPLKCLNFPGQAVEFMIGDLRLSFDGIGIM
jgi:hypothetical protein